MCVWGVRARVVMVCVCVLASVCMSGRGCMSAGVCLRACRITYPVRYAQAPCFLRLLWHHHIFRHCLINGTTSSYADNVAPLARSLTALKVIFYKLQNEATLVGLKINENKTKYMQIRRTGTKDITHLKIDNLPLKCRKL